MSHVGIMKIEAGERSPQLRTVLKMAAALKVNPAWLFG
ncbi:MAG: helix-turn-helix domain-containing protein [Luteolibacter sp.]